MAGIDYFKERFGVSEKVARQMVEGAASIVEEDTPQLTEKEQEVFAEYLQDELDEFLPETDEDISPIEFNEETRIQRGDERED